MKTPYSSLLVVRETEEKEAEVAVADAQRRVVASEEALSAAHRAREAWIQHYLTQSLADQSTAGLAALLARIERVEREAETRLREATDVLDDARETLLRRRKSREAVERLHLEVLQTMERAIVRRAQAELDEVGARGARTRVEIDDDR